MENVYSVIPVLAAYARREREIREALEIKQEIRIRRISRKK